MNTLPATNDVSVRYKKLFAVLVILLVVCLYGYRIFLLVDYCFKYVDKDTAIYWCATVDYANGFFPEPFFYGQNYGLMTEALLAVPLYWMHVPLWIAVPLVSMIVYTLPFIIIAASTWKRDPLTSVLIMLIPCMLGLEYDLVTTAPRAFGGSYVLAVIGSLLLIEFCNENTLKTQLIHGLGAFLIMLGAIANISSLTISSFSICFILIRKFFNGKSIKENFRTNNFMGSLIGLFLGAVLLFVLNGFYIFHPEYNVYGSTSLSPSLSNLAENLSEIKDLFASYSPADNLWFVFPIMLVLIFLFILVFRRKTCWQLSFLVIMSIIGTLLIMTTSKSRDFDPTSYLYSAARLYVFFPYLITMLLYASTFYEKRTIDAQKARPFVIAAIPLLLLLTLSSGALKIHYLKDIMSKENNSLTSFDPILDVVSVEEVRKDAEKTKQACSDNNLKYVLYFTEFRSTRAYAGGALNYGTVTTYNSIFERRTWIYRELQEQNSVPLKVYAITDSKEGIITIPSGESAVQHLEKLGCKRYVFD